MTTKYTFTSEDTEKGESFGFPRAKTTIEFEAKDIFEVLEGFQQFLKGSGFEPTGRLDFVNDNDNLQPNLPGFSLVTHAGDN
jgi:hypothetical protein